MGPTGPGLHPLSSCQIRIIKGSPTKYVTLYMNLYGEVKIMINKPELSRTCDDQTKDQTMTRLCQDYDKTMTITNSH